MRINRHTLVSKNQPQIFHVISRVVDRRLIFGDTEKGFFLGLMRRLEKFSGLEILSYCLMGNHFHLLLRVPVKPADISTEEVRERMKVIYSDWRMALFDAEIEQKRDSGYIEFEEEFYDRQRRRMYDLSAFVRELKLTFSKWYNRRNERKGTLWEERFKSVLVEGREGAMMRVAAYIELNPIRAGIVDDPCDYRWCSYTEAIAGGEKARSGIMKLSGSLAQIDDWDAAASKYRENYLKVGVAQNEKRKGFGQEKLKEFYDKNSRLSGDIMWKARIRYFTDGVVIGSREFVENFSSINKDFLLRKGRRKSYLLGKLENIFSYRLVK